MYTIQKHLTPAEYVILVFKGVRATARVLGRSPSSVSKWTKSKELRGTDGNVPSSAARAILSIARERCLDITPNDLLNGRTIEELPVGNNLT